jgi:FkbH-like protein
LEQNCSSREDFYRYLQQEAEISAVDPATFPRVVQLTQKTNQFNLTTRRYTEQQLAEKLAQPDWHAFSIAVRDRFGDNGVVGASILHRLRGIWEIDTFLLSCRVIGRTVETAFLSCLVGFARSQGAEQLQGWFLATRKNVPAKDFYLTHGFSLVRQDGEGSLWTMDLSQASCLCPEWIRLTVPNGSLR